MSTTIMGQCWQLQMPPTPKSVLISLADNANDHGDCFPSIPTICERTCLGRTAVIDAIKWLEQHGAVVADRSNGRHTTYRVTPKAYRNQSATRTGPADGPVRQTDDTRPPDGRDPSATRTLTVKEPSINRQKENAHACPPEVEAGQWADWLALRKAKRAPVSATALDGIRREAAKAGMTLQAALAECCARGWTGFKADWVRPRIAAPPTAADRRAAFVASLYGQTTDPRIVDVEQPEPAAPRLSIGGR